MKHFPYIQRSLPSILIAVVVGKMLFHLVHHLFPKRTEDTA